MKYLSVGDLHFGARNFNPIIAAWQRKFFAERFFPLLEELKPDAIVFMGDLYDDHKGPTSAVIDFSYEVCFDPLKAYPGIVYALVGNHDSYYRDSIKCHSLRRIERLTVIETPTVIDSILFLPWLVESDYPTLDKYFDDASIKFTLGHLELNGGMVYPGRFWKDGLDASRLPGKIWSGHFHSPSENYVGTPYDLTWAEYKDTKRMILIDTADGTSLELPCLTENLHIEVESLQTDVTNRIVRTRSQEIAESVQAAEVVFDDSDAENVDESKIEQIDIHSAFFQVLGDSLAMKLVERVL